MAISREEEETDAPPFTVLNLSSLPLSRPTATPPMMTSVSVPFRWEEEPGKPRSFYYTDTTAAVKCLQLPPSRRTPETPLSDYTFLRRHKSSSFRMWAHDSFDGSNCSCNSRDNPPEKETAKAKAAKKKGFLGGRRLGFGRTGTKTESEIIRYGSFSGVYPPTSSSSSSFWAYVRKAVPWELNKKKKTSKEANVFSNRWDVQNHP